MTRTQQVCTEAENSAIVAIMKRLANRAHHEMRHSTNVHGK